MGLNIVLEPGVSINLGGDPLPAGLGTVLELGLGINPMAAEVSRLRW